MLKRSSIFSLAILAVAVLTAIAEDWPQFRGPTGQGHSAESGLPLEWSETRNVKWKTAVPGQGWSSPVISQGRVWLTTSVRDRNAASLRLMGFDAVTGFVPIPSP